MDIYAGLETCQVGAHFKALDEDVLLASLDSRYTQVGFKFYLCSSVYVLNDFSFLCPLSPRFSTLLARQVIRLKLIHKIAFASYVATNQMFCAAVATLLMG